MVSAALLGRFPHQKHSCMDNTCSKLGSESHTLHLLAGLVSPCMGFGGACLGRAVVLGSVLDCERCPLGRFPVGRRAQQRDKWRHAAGVCDGGRVWWRLVRQVGERAGCRLGRAVVRRPPRDQAHQRCYAAAAGHCRLDACSPL